MTDEIFADRFGDVSVTGSTIRIDLVSLSPSERDAQGQPLLRFRQRVVLPIEGFLRSSEMMQRMLDVLVEQGIVRRGDVAARGDAARGDAPAAPVDQRQTLVASPNFPRAARPSDPG